MNPITSGEPVRVGWWRQSIRGRGMWHFGAGRRGENGKVTVGARCGREVKGFVSAPLRYAESSMDIPGRAKKCRLCLAALQKAQSRG